MAFQAVDTAKLSRKGAAFLNRQLSQLEVPNLLAGVPQLSSCVDKSGVMILSLFVRSSSGAIYSDDVGVSLNIASPCLH